MITATQALRLPSAQLTEEEKRAADVLEQAIDNHVRQHMTRAGLSQVFTTTEKRPAVIAEVAHRLRKGKWVPVWEQNLEPAKFSRNLIHTGWKLTGLGPSEEAYCEADPIVASA